MADNRSKHLQHFGAQVRSVRESRSLTQEQLADLAGLDRTYISLVERGHRNAALLNIIKIAHALQLTPGELLSISPVKHPNGR